MRIVRRSGAALALLVLIIVGALALGLLVPRGPAAGSGGSGTGRHEIVLLANAIHTDIALPAEPAVLQRLSFLAEAGLPLDRPDVGHVLVGWGGRAFYTQTPTWADLRASAVSASLTVDDSVLHFVLTPAIEPGFPGTRRLVLDDAEFAALLDFVDESLSRGEDGLPLPIPVDTYGPYDRFYEAEGWFNVVLGCNTWTGAALRRAGIATGAWTPLPQALFWSLDLHADGKP